MPSVILVSGKKGSGKDTFYSQLKKSFGPHINRLAFADEVKRDLGLDPLGMTWEEKNKLRDKIIKHAEKMKKDDPTYWCKRLFNDKTREELKKFTVTFITDWRFIAEYEFVKDLCEEEELNLYTLRILGGCDDGDMDPSETELDSFDKFDIIRPASSSN